jgi:hypothetical protein
MTNPTAPASDTPRVDAAEFSVECYVDCEWRDDVPVVHADFARTLERELAATNKEAYEAVLLQELCEGLRAELAAARAELEAARKDAIDTSRATRFEAIDHRASGLGRDYVRYGVSVNLMMQDEGRTLKVFLRETMEPLK